MKTLENLFEIGIALALVGGGILFVVEVYVAFQESLEWGFEVMGFLTLIIGIILAFVGYLAVPTDYFMKK